MSKINIKKGRWWGRKWKPKKWYYGLVFPNVLGDKRDSCKRKS